MARYIDAHVHITPESELWKVNPYFHTQLMEYGYKKMGDGGIQIMPPYIHDSQFTADTLVAMMNVYDVEKAIIMQTLMAPYNDEVAKAVRRYPERLTGAMVLEPKAGCLDEMIRWHEEGLNVIKYEMRAQSDPNLFPNICYDSDVMMSMFEMAEKLGLTVTIDPGPVDFPIYRPDAMMKAVRAFPNVHFVICHLCYPMPLDRPELVGKWESMVQVTELPNCWVDCSAMPDMFDAEGWPYPTAHKILKKVISVAGIDSIIWGSDITGTLNRATYPQMIDMFRRTDFLSEEDLDKIFYQNAKVAYRI